MDSISIILLLSLAPITAGIVYIVHNFHSILAWIIAIALALLAMAISLLLVNRQIRRNFVKSYCWGCPCPTHGECKRIGDEKRCYWIKNVREAYERGNARTSK